MKVGLWVGVLAVSRKLMSPLCWIGETCLITGFSGPRGKLLGLVGFGGDV